LGGEGTPGTRDTKCITGREGGEGEGSEEKEEKVAREGGKWKGTRFFFPSPARVCLCVCLL